MFLRELDAGRWEVLLKNAGRCRPGEAVSLAGGHRDFDVLLQTLEDFDVAGDGDLFQEEDVIRPPRMNVFPSG